VLLGVNNRQIYPTQASIRTVPGRCNDYEEQPLALEANQKSGFASMYSSCTEDLKTRHEIQAAGCASFGRGLFLGSVDASRRTRFHSIVRDIFLTIGWLAVGWGVLYLIGTIALKLFGKL
jgi:hypothetical protein